MVFVQEQVEKEEELVQVKETTGSTEIEKKSGEMGLLVEHMFVLFCVYIVHPRNSLAASNMALEIR